MLQRPQVLYRTTATATGQGRDGRAATADGALDVRLVTPRELGGAGGAGTNPEQLFATGYAACFLSALRHVATAERAVLPADLAVTCEVGIGRVPAGFGLEVALRVAAPSLDAAGNAVGDRERLAALVARAHEVCPYSNATRGNVAVELTVA